jgi:hypothetical protein
MHGQSDGVGLGPEDLGTIDVHQPSGLRLEFEDHLELAILRRKACRGRHGGCPGDMFLGQPGREDPIETKRPLCLGAMAVGVKEDKSVDTESLLNFNESLGNRVIGTGRIGDP